MKTRKFETTKKFKKMFDFNFSPAQIKTVNGIAVNVCNGALIYNELAVTQMNVTISSYFTEKQGDTTSSLHAPFIVEF